jgi:hypothetical protein
MARRLDGHSSLIKDRDQPTWDRIPVGSRHLFQRAVYLSVSSLTSNDTHLSFAVEWDDMSASTFRGSEFWSGVTNTAEVRVRKVGNAKLLSIQSDAPRPWPVAYRISKVVTEHGGLIAPRPIPLTAITRLQRDDSVGDRNVRYRDVEAGTTGILRGSVRRNSALRSQMQRSGKLEYVQFDSRALGGVVGILGPKGRIACRRATVGELTGYYEEKIFPHLDD